MDNIERYTRGEVIAHLPISGEGSNICVGISQAPYTKMRYIAIASLVLIGE